MNMPDAGLALLRMAALYLAVGAGVVGGLLTEPASGAGYKRRPFSGQASAGSLVIGAGVSFGPASAAWGPLTIMAAFASAIATTVLYSAALSGLPVAAGQFLSIPAGAYTASPGGVPAPFAWTPSPARVLPLFGQATMSPSLNQAAVLPLRWPDMPSIGATDCGVDFSAILAGGDTIASVSVNPGALQLIATAQLGGIVYLWLSGGQSGIDYPVAITVASAAGRIVNRVVRVMVV